MGIGAWAFGGEHSNCPTQPPPQPAASCIRMQLYAEPTWREPCHGDQRLVLVRRAAHLFAVRANSQIRRRLRLHPFAATLVADSHH